MAELSIMNGIRHFRPKRRHVVYAVLAAPLAVLLLLNLNGFCWAQLRFLTDKELIDFAIRSNLSFHEPSRSWNKVYTSPDDVRAQNPDCCSIVRKKNEDAELPQFLMSMLGMYASTVKVVYRTSDTGPEPFNDSWFIIGACGEIGRRWGMDLATHPKGK